MTEPSTDPTTFQRRLLGLYASGFHGRHEPLSAAEVSRWGRSFRAWVRGWLPNRTEAAIADLGCGDGRLLRWLNGAGFRNLTGVDLSPEQVTLACQAGLAVVHGDALEFLERRPGTFDCLFATDLIEHLERPQALRFLDLCHIALRPGGRLVLQTPNGDSPHVGPVRYGDPTHITCYTPSSLAFLMHAAGFVAISAREQSPVASASPGSAIRAMLWTLLRGGIRLRNRIETGSPGSGCHTRVMFVSGVRP